MKSLFVLIKKDLLEQWRTKKILTVIIVMLFAAIASPILAKLTPELLKSVSVPGLTIDLPPPTYKDSIDQFVKNVSQIGLLVIIFVTAGAVADEKNRKMLDMILTKPFSRDNFILSKFKAYFISMSAVFGLAAIIFYAYTSILFSVFDAFNFAIMLIGMLVYILMVMSVTILASTVVKNSIAAGGVGFLFFVLFGTVMNLIEPLKNFSPNIFLDRYKDIIQNGWVGDYWLPLFTIVLVILISMIAAVIIFRGQEVER